MATCAATLAAGAVAATSGSAVHDAVHDAVHQGDQGTASTTARVAVFFYPWWGTPLRNGAYEHWGQNGAQPPRRIASSFFPARGVYSSTDPGVLAAQMADIAGTGAGTVIVSWWGQGSIEDQRLPSVIDAARRAGLRVAIHIEPYVGRTPATVAADVARLQAVGIGDFYVYDTDADPDGAWRAAIGGLHGVRLFANTGLPGRAAAGGFAGFYTYDVYVYNGQSFIRICASARRLHLLCAPSVGPGYDARRATGDLHVRGRRNGETYDEMWRSAIRARADVVTITSYNEWHEGTQIEPAAEANGYESYDGAWGLHGKAAQRAYLDRTAYWVSRYRTLSGRG